MRGDGEDRVQGDPAGQISRQIIACAQEGILVCGRDYRFAVWNPYMEALSGLPAEQVIGRHPLEVFPFLKEQGIWELFERAMAGERVATADYPFFVPSTGRSGWARNEYVPLLDAQGEVAGVIGTVHGITDRKRAEEALRLSEERLRLALQGAALGTWDGNVQTGEMSVNQRWAEMLGYSLEEIEPHRRNWERLIHPEDLPRVQEAVRSHVEGETPRFELEYRLRAKSGDWIWVLDTGQVVERDATGRPLRAAGVHLDITAQKRAEEQLRQASRMESLGRLAGGIAHQFNNLLTVINGYSALALAGLYPGHPLADHLRAISDAGAQAAGLTRQLLAVSRRQVVAPQALDLSRVVAESVPMLQRLAGENIELVTRLAPAAGQVMSDSDQMKQVLVNLAVNAREAMPQGGRIIVETAAVTVDEACAAGHPGVERGRYVVLAFSDTGVGLDQETQDHVFEPFFSARALTNGVGLGLAIVHGIVTQNGGSIRVESHPGQGTTFKIYWPQVAEEAAVAPQLPGPPGKPAVTGTVLIVEDQPQVRSLMVEALRSSGHRILAASCGEEALRLAGEHADEIHLLVTDVVMPGMDGRELAGRLKTLRPHLKTLYVSGYPADVIAPRGLLSPDAAYLAKPFSPDGLAAKVRQLLEP